MSNDRGVINVRFNQDQGCFACCMESGLRIYNVEPLVEKAHYDVELVGSVKQCEMIYRTNLFAVVSGGSRPKFADNIVLIYDDALKKFMLELTFPSTVLSVRMRRDKLIVALTTQVITMSLYSLSNTLINLSMPQEYDYFLILLRTMFYSLWYYVFVHT